MRIIEDRCIKDSDETRVECYYCESIFTYGEDDVCKSILSDKNMAKVNEYIRCPCCGKRMWLDDFDVTSELIEYPIDFFQYKTRHDDADLTQWAKDAIKQMEENGDIGIIEGDALVIAIKDYESSNFARVFICKDYAQSDVKIPRKNS